MSRKRNGFTIIELVVVTAVISLLMGILIPAVQRVRESARRTQCVSHLSQIGKALHGYESNHKKLPPSASGSESMGSPHVHLLPWLEQTALFERLKPFDSLIGPLNAGSDEQRLALAIFRCPSDVGGGISNYAYCVGANVVTEPWAPSPLDGPFTTFSKSRTFSEVTDGLSNTAAVSEKLSGSWDTRSFDRRRDIAFSGIEALKRPLSSITPEDMKSACRGLDPRSGRFNPFAGRSWSHVTYLGAWYNHALPPNPDCPPCATHSPSRPVGGAPFIAPFRGVFPATSMHDSAVNVLLLDGSVRSVGDSIDSELWRAVGTHSGGESLSQI